jgi:hypothetical protein
MSHPFYTGKMKLVDTAGRVDKFRTRYQKGKKPAADRIVEHKSPYEEAAPFGTAFFCS